MIPIASVRCLFDKLYIASTLYLHQKRLEEEEQDRLADEAVEKAQAEIDAAEAAEDAAMRDMQRESFC